MSGDSNQSPLRTVHLRSPRISRGKENSTVWFVSEAEGNQLDHFAEVFLSKNFSDVFMGYDEAVKRIKEDGEQPSMIVVYWSEEQRNEVLSCLLEIHNKKFNVIIQAAKSRDELMSACHTKGIVPTPDVIELDCTKGDLFERAKEILEGDQQGRKRK